MVTNADKTVDDDDKPVTEEDLRSLKYSEDDVETTEVEDEASDDNENEEDSEDASEDDDQIADDATEEEDDDSSDDAPAFVKEFDYIKGDTPEEYAKNLELAYKNSTSEALRLKDELKAVSTTPPAQDKKDDDTTETTVTNPLELYAKQKMDEEIQSAFDTFRGDYPQVSDPTEYAKFTNEVATFSHSILQSQKRLASPAELYNKAAISLGWEKKDTKPDSKEKLDMALKNGAATSKTTSAPTKKSASGPKVSEAMLKVNRMMYPGKTDQEIIEELSPHLQ